MDETKTAERPLMQRLRNFDGYDVKQTYTDAANRIEQLESALDFAIEGLRYCEERYGYDDQRRLNVESAGAIRSLASAPAEQIDGYVMVPQSAIDWLMGLGDDFVPTPEQEKRSYGPGKYWWRSEFSKRAGLPGQCSVEATPRQTGETK